MGTKAEVPNTAGKKKLNISQRSLFPLLSFFITRRSLREVFGEVQSEHYISTTSLKHLFWSCVVDISQTSLRHLSDIFWLSQISKFSPLQKDVLEMFQRCSRDVANYISFQKFVGDISQTSLRHLLGIFWLGKISKFSPLQKMF